MNVKKADNVNVMDTMQTFLSVNSHFKIIDPLQFKIVKKLKGLILVLPCLLYAFLRLRKLLIHFQVNLSLKMLHNIGSNLILS